MKTCLIFALIAFCATSIHTSEHTKKTRIQKSIDEQTVASGQGFLGTLLCLLCPQLTIEQAQAQRRLSEENPEVLKKEK